MNQVAITGKIGSGKTTALNYFRRAGHFAISSDFIIRSIYENEETRSQLLKKLGIEKKNYKEVIIEKIKDPSFNYKLKKSIYPIMGRLRSKRIPTFITKKNIFFEVPLLYEEKLERNYDKVIFIKSNFIKRLKRTLIKGKTKEYFETMNRYQGADAIKERLSDITICNNGSKIDFYNSLIRCEKEIWEKLFLI